MRKEGKIKWYLRPVGVVLLLFFVLGPFGLPLLYKSPKFSKNLKIVLTIVVIIYTSYLIIALVEIGRNLYKDGRSSRHVEANTILPLIDIDFRSSKNEVTKDLRVTS